MRRRGRALLTAALLAAGLGCVLSVTQTPTPQEHTVPVPDRFKADAAPELVDAGIDGCKKAPSLDPNLYYCAKDEHWFRYALNRWYMAFAWDGNWFPTTKSDLPKSLAALTPAPAAVKQSREERLKQLEKELEELDPNAPHAEKPPENEN